MMLEEESKEQLELVAGWGWVTCGGWGQPHVCQVYGRYVVVSQQSINYSLLSPQLKPWENVSTLLHVCFILTQDLDLTWSWKLWYFVWLQWRMFWNIRFNPCVYLWSCSRVDSEGCFSSSCKLMQLFEGRGQPYCHRAGFMSLVWTFYLIYNNLIALNIYIMQSVLLIFLQIWWRFGIINDNFHHLNTDSYRNQEFIQHQW